MTERSTNFGRSGPDPTEEQRLALGVFVKALEVGSLGPLEQCEKMGNYNVAWEIRDDLFRGLHWFNQIERTAEQERVANDLAQELKGIPESVLCATADCGENRHAMEHISWVPVRRESAHLLRLLRQ